MNGKKGQVFRALLVTGMMVLMFILATPYYLPIVHQAAEDIGGVPAFFMILIPFVMAIALIALVFKVSTSGADFF